MSSRHTNYEWMNEFSTESRWTNVCVCNCVDHKSPTRNAPISTSTLFRFEGISIAEHHVLIAHEPPRLSAKYDFGMWCVSCRMFGHVCNGFGRVVCNDKLLQFLCLFHFHSTLGSHWESHTRTRTPCSAKPWTKRKPRNNEPEEN